MELILIIGLLFAYVVLLICSLLYILWLGQSLLFSAPFVPLPKEVVKQLINNVFLNDGDIFYDLGSGDGRVIRAVSRSYPKALCIGVEKALLPNVLSWFYSKRFFHSNIRFLRQDYNTVSLEKADVVFLYLWPGAMPGILEKIRQETPRNAKIICCRFPFPNTIPTDTQLISNGGKNYNLYTYHVEHI